MKDKNTILAVDDDLKFLSAIKDALASNYNVVTAPNASMAMAAIHRAEPDLMLLDMNMPELSGMEFLRITKRRTPQLPIVMLTGETDPSLIVEAMKCGASDYVIKGSDDFASNLQFRVSQVLQFEGMKNEFEGIKKQNELLTLRVKKEEAARYEILGNSAATLKLRAEITKFKGTSAYFLIGGENGTGKELIARNLHMQEDKPSRPFVAVNCGAISENLFESAFFGHVKGSFTGAIANKDGFFVAASGGDLFLDEIGELPLEMQVKLLRVLEERTVTPVGSEKPVSVNVRVIAATNRNLEELVRAGKFRQDLFFRLNKIPLSTIPLRERKEDILLLANSFAAKFVLGASFSKETQSILQNYSWPGNIRELFNVVERACLMIRGNARPLIKPEHLYFSDLENKIQGIVVPTDLFPSMADNVTEENFQNCIAWFEKTYFENALELLKGDNGLLFKRLGISKAVYYRKKRELGLSENGGLRVL